jgi:hypothetical protein
MKLQLFVVLNEASPLIATCLDSETENAGMKREGVLEM